MYLAYFFGGKFMKNGKKLGLTIFQVVLSIILIALIIFSVGVNYIFGSSVRSGKVFGKNIYIMYNDSMDSEGGIPNGSAVIADSNEIAVLTEGNVILFNEEAGIETVMRIVEVVHNTDNTVYCVATDKEPDNVLNVPKENVIAKCITQSVKLGNVITFLKSMVGILAGMILPCLILLVMLVLKIFSVRRKAREEENIVFPETSFGIGSNHNENRDPSANPLFDPTMVPKPGADFVEKKSSIAENFSMKPAAKKNITMETNQKNIREQNAVEKFRAAVDEKPPVPVAQKASLAPEAPITDRNEKMAAIKNALNEQDDIRKFEEFNPDKTAAFTIPNQTASPVKSPEDIQQAKPSYVSQPNPAENPQPVPQPAPAPKPAPRKQDNIKSIDDLIKALEEEKKKL